MSPDATESREPERTISEGDRLKLVGLLVLAAEINRDFGRVARAVAKLVGEEGDGDGYYGHASDAVAEAGTGSVYDGPGRLLQALKIKVVPDA